MSSTTCPVCNSENHHQFWYWEKEDKLLRDWALDTRLSFSICRDCSAIFQNPKAENTDSAEGGFGGWGDAEPVYPADEPLMWLKQFSPNGEKKGRALEVYHSEKRFAAQLLEDGWESVKSISTADLLNPPDIHNEEMPAADERFDVVFCFDLLGRQADPVGVLQAVHPYVDTEGGVYIEVQNPGILPRLDKICLSSTDQVVLPFHSLIFAMHKAGFMNSGAEICGKIRCFGKKIIPNPDTMPDQVMPEKLWEHILYRFQRNYYWTKTARYLKDYIVRIQGEPQLMEAARQELRQDPNLLQVIRDVCGGSLLFAQEVNELQNSLSEDWYRSMARIFEVFKNDFALYDLLQLSGIDGLGVFDGIERFHYKEKMIYMTNEEYFQKYFTEDEARDLCHGIIRAGQQVCGNLSSFL